MKREKMGEEEEEKETGIFIRCDQELADRFRKFKIEHHCRTYRDALKVLLDVAEKRCVVTDRCTCVEEESVLGVY
jgi:hypothetical protein